MSDLVNIESLVSGYLRDQDFRARVSPPDESHRGESWVEYSLINAPSDDIIPVEWLTGFMLDFRCYAGATGGQPEAHDLVYAVREALALLPKTSFDDAVVTQVKFLAMPYVPDTEMEPARERYVLTARIYAHPNSGGGS